MPTLIKISAKEEGKDRGVSSLKGDYKKANTGFLLGESRVVEQA